MLTQLSRNWWLFTLRGVAALVFGILALAWHRATLTVLILLFGAYALIDGLLAVFAALAHRTGGRWSWSLLEGLVGITVGILTFVWPGATAFSLLYLMAIWAILTGVLEILAAVELRQLISNEWLLLLSGIASVIFGMLVVLFPGTGVQSILWLIAAYAVVYGLLLVVLSLRLKPAELDFQPEFP